MEMKSGAAALDSLSIILFLDAATVHDLKTKLPVYLAKAADISAALRRTLNSHSCVGQKDSTRNPLVRSPLQSAAC